jgi:hypothetical protein
MYWMSGKAGCGKADPNEDRLVEARTHLPLREFIARWIGHSGDRGGSPGEIRRPAQWHAGSIYSTSISNISSHVA